jgi:hypothetical protein
MDDHHFGYITIFFIKKTTAKDMIIFQLKEKMVKQAICCSRTSWLVCGDWTKNWEHCRLPKRSGSYSFWQPPSWAIVNKHAPAHHEGWLVSGYITVFCWVPIP